MAQEGLDREERDPVIEPHRGCGMTSGVNTATEPDRPSMPGDDLVKLPARKLPTVERPEDRCRASGNRKRDQVPTHRPTRCRRQGHPPLMAEFALPDEKPIGVEVTTLELTELAGTKPRGAENRQDGPITETGAGTGIRSESQLDHLRRGVERGDLSGTHLNPTFH